VVLAHRLLAATDAKVTADVMPSEQPIRVMLRVNGRSHTLLVEPRCTLLYVLGENIGLTGTKGSCSCGECGACGMIFLRLPKSSASAGCSV
jgi:xanthine dehydrogenase iron-sulfur cluster and FAD-binding subunit A